MKEAPEGGWGWMIVAACFLATICIRAVTRCISMFFVEFQLHFGKDYSTTAWIHSLIDSTTMLCAPLGSFVGNRLSCRATVILGGLLSSAGLTVSSFASSLEFLYISLGVVTGLGFALSYTLSIAMVGRYFVERKALAYGIALSGSGIGTFLLAPAVQMLIEFYSWRGALLILGGFVSNLCVCGALMRPAEPQRDERTSETTTLPEASFESKPTAQVTFDLNQEQKTPIFRDSQNFFVTKAKLQSFSCDNDELLRNVNLPKPSSPDRMLTDSNGSIEDLKAVESKNSTNASTSPSVEIEKVTNNPEKSVPAETPVIPSGGRGFRPESSEFGFLLIPDFLVLSVSFLFLAFGCSAPVVYLVPYALSVGLDHQHAAFLMSIFGISGIVGNLTYGWMMDRRCVKSYRMLSYMLAVSMEGLCCVFLPFLHSFPLLAPFVALYGYFDGAYVALIPVVTSDAVGSSDLTSALGLVYFLHAIPYLLSPPIGGWLVDQTGNYAATFLLCGVSYFLSSLILAVARLVKHVATRWEKVKGQEHRSLKRNLSELVPFLLKEKL